MRTIRFGRTIFLRGAYRGFHHAGRTLGYTRNYIRHILNETEHKNIRQYGYGVRSFGRSLEETYLKLAEMASREIVEEVDDGDGARKDAAEILDGVPETLAYLTSATG